MFAIGILTYLLVAILSVVDLDEAFDTGEPLMLAVAGCDVDIVPGPSARIRLQRYLSAGSGHTVDYDPTGQYLNLMIAVNKGCNDMPRMDCRNLCLLTITVPPSNARIFLEQRLGACPRAGESSPASSLAPCAPPPPRPPRDR